MHEPHFLTVEDLLFIHKEEIITAGGAPNIRQEADINACTEAPKASYGGKCLNDLYDMAASYIICLAIRHPFVDGNRRTALASALTFLYLNGYEVQETYDLELADLVLNFLSKDITKDEIASHLRSNTIKK
jgi:death-on-curing protein